MPFAFVATGNTVRFDCAMSGKEHLIIYRLVTKGEFFIITALMFPVISDVTVWELPMTMLRRAGKFDVCCIV